MNETFEPFLALSEQDKLSDGSWNRFSVPRPRSTNEILAYG